MAACLRTGTTYPDEYLDHWGDEYVRRGLTRYGILFETFLGSPREIIDAIDETDFRPLLPAQQAVSDALGRDIQASHEAELGTRARAAGGALREPLRHHSYAVSQDTGRRPA
jgi:hypothetical protein